MKKRIIAALLAVCTLISIGQAPGAVSANTASSYDIEITVDGEPVSNVSLPQSTRKEIAAEAFPAAEKGDYSWQICAEMQNDLWVDIYGAGDQTLTLSYALISSLLDAAGSAYIRAVLTVDGKRYTSAPLCVTVAYQASLESDVNPQERAALKTKAGKTRAAGKAGSDLATISINYLDWESREEIYSPYTATIEKGTVFEQSVISPTFLGYAPYTVAEQGDGTYVFTDATTYLLQYAAGELTGDVVINIYYKAIEVSYAASFFFQNVNNDLYTERTDLYYSGRAETGTIIEDDFLADLAGNTEGFSKLYHYPEAVAADGSTVFQCYYDRNYYLLKFDMDGGYGVDPIYARYETPYIVSEPVRYGYVFAGWDLLTEDTNGNGEPDQGDGVADALPATIEVGNQNYRALWTTAETTYDVVYWLENARDENGDVAGNGYSFLTSKGDIAAMSNDRISGADHQITNETDAAALGVSADIWRNSYYDHADEDVVVKGDGSTVVNVYYHRKEYTLKFYYAMTKNSGGTPEYYVVGGSTYAFGKDAAYGVDTGNEVALLDQYINEDGSVSGNVGQVEALPALNANGAGKNYQLGQDVSIKNSDFTYHYISFTAKYGAVISEKWPIDVFNSATRTEGNTQNDWTSRAAVVSAWNGEHHVAYSQNNANQTIKGKYERLNEELLWDLDFGSPADQTVSYLCFWENGADISWSVPELYRYHIYVPLLENQSTEGLTIRTHQGIDYYELDVYDTCDDSNVESQTAVAITGFTYVDRDFNTISDHDTGLYRDAFDVYFYYSRNTYELSFINYGTRIETRTLSYGENLRDDYIDPPYPENMEPDAYYFDGWYESPTHAEGSEVVFDETLTMPARNWQLYAKYTPMQHTVLFFKTRADMQEYQSTQDEALVYERRQIEHGETLGAITTPVDPSGQNYTFGGWFYFAADQTMQAFATYSMPINGDLLIFAEWGSRKSQPYLIHYALNEKETDPAWLALLSTAAGGSPEENRSYFVTNEAEARDYVYADGGYHLQIAGDTVGYAYEGSTRTFPAKAGDPYNQLYDAYNNGYFPIVASHSITIASEPEGVDQPESNVFTFFYVNPEMPIPYTVRYLDKQTGLPVAEERILSTSKAVVTERFLPVANYIPDAFYKRLIISVEYDEEQGTWVGSDEDNVITFYYMLNETVAYYAVHYMMQKPGTDGTDHNTIDTEGDYEANQSIIEGIADIDSNVEITPLTFDGFTAQDTGRVILDGAEHEIAAKNGRFQITVTAIGTELYIYYTRLKYDVTVHYLKYNTDEPVDPDRDPIATMANQDFGTVVSHTAPRIFGGYALVDTQNMTQSTVVRSNPAQNVLTFYYTELQYIAEYKIIGDTGGTLSSTIEVRNSSDGFIGSTASADPGYAFSGWYLDEAGTIPAEAKATITGAELVPKVNALEPMPTTNVFYAKFELQTTDLTITRANTADESKGDQVFVYKITDNTDPARVYYATITGSGSVVIRDLPCVEYTVEQVNSWSWRYTDAARTVALTEARTLTFSAPAVADAWLNGNSGVVANKRN